MGRSRPWGWHALHPTWADLLVADAALPRGALVLDIGAGHGAITERLLAAGGRIIAVEAHPGRVRHLRERFGDSVKVVRADAADLRLPRRPFHVVANPPFGITAPLLRRLLHDGSRMESARIVLQTQAVAKWTSSEAPGAQRWKHRFEVRPGPKVPRRAFQPPPQVDCRILQITRR